MGPILSFRGNMNESWSVSILIVTDLQTNPPVASITVDQAGSNATQIMAKLLRAIPITSPNVEAWRFDLSIPQTEVSQTVIYEIEGAKESFVVPSRGSVPNMGY